MPITKSAKKALKRSEKNHERNLVFKNKMKSSVKAVKKNVVELKKAGAVDKKAESNLQEMIAAAYSTIDKAQKTNVIHKNTAARKKSRLTKMVNKLVAA